MCFPALRTRSHKTQNHIFSVNKNPILKHPVRLFVTFLHCNSLVYYLAPCTMQVCAPCHVVCCIFLLAPPAERQRSFSNADSSVVRPSSVRRPSVVNFSIKSLISQKLSDNFFSFFWHVASLGWYQCIVKIWIWLNHPKGHFERSERSNLAPFFYLEAIFSKTVW